MVENVFILDNGAYSAKVEFSKAKKPKIVPNCIVKAKAQRRRFIGNQVDECGDLSSLFYILPFQKGYLLNWEVQKTVWDYIFSKECCPVNFSETPLIVTEPYFNFNSIQEVMHEIFFEEYECQSLLKMNAGDLCNYNYRKNNPQALCCLVVDTGYSFTHIAPYIKDKKYKPGIRRIDVGGKVLTNHLKEIISYRQLHVMDETYVMNQVKEDACYVSQDFIRDMETAKHSKEKARDYVLPDFTSIRRGYVRAAGQPDEGGHQILHLNNEQFAVPEVLLRPSDIGISQMGITEAIVNSVASCPEEVRPHLFNNVLIVGGCAKFPGFQQRVQRELRSMTPEEFDVRVTIPEDPITYAWQGGTVLSQDPEFYTYCVSKEEYDEEGHALCFEKFDTN
ncbi:actin-related protein 6 isoform X2 [Nilaparvata lugens]|uniref:actin-related protein 6 isoform X2 n=1 Tax=Nilaparvata lugens TaxID=108931 RepID=UPI00193E07B6|nr:actin-related protein 6 isoform X2 [Nilaparvata lugens]